MRLAKVILWTTPLIFSTFCKQVISCKSLLQHVYLSDRLLWHLLSKTHCISTLWQRKRVACKNVANYIFVFIVKLARITKPSGWADCPPGGASRAIFRRKQGRRERGECFMFRCKFRVFFLLFCWIVVYFISFSRQVAKC